ncbi:Ig-like domain-containing protein [Clostridium akagii]|uniref:Ig-like domain-containing protein n=1 Tax=Clostridium akagii TaxID=91623 RepID=UPI0009FD4B80|nr:Ig-like domain-containing protein [Clostridium akagii]
MKKLLSIFFVAILIISSLPVNTFADTTPIGVSYQGHVENIGWQSPVSNGTEAGTDGKALRVEALKINLTNAPAGAKIVYQAHVENVGWQSSVSDGAEAGTDGKALRVEGIKIWLQGLPGYTVQYRAHVQNIGWQTWVSDGSLAGTTGKAYRIEAIEIRVVPSSVTLNKATDELSVGQSDNLLATVASLVTNNQAVNWTSSDESVAKVDSTGKVTATKAGITSITATTLDGYKAASCNVTVNNVNATGISLSKTTDTLLTAGTDTLVATVAPENATNKAVNWTSSDASIVTVDASGNVVALKAGVATVTATTLDGNKSASCTINVNTLVNVSGISLNKTTDDLTSGQTDNLTAMVTPDNATNKGVAWTSSNNSMVTVDNNGKIVAVSAGNAIITAKTADGNNVATCNVNVTSTQTDGISVEYEGHVESVGWQNYVSDGEIAGTEGKGLRLEALKMQLINAPKGAKIIYQAHVQNIGWQSQFSDGGEAGTDGQALRIEALKISLANMPGYSVEYKAQVQNDGWQSWVKDGAVAGTQGRALRLEAIKIRIVKNISIQYKINVENTGWEAPVSDGTVAGTQEKPLRIEAINMQLSNAPQGATLKYQTHVENIGWQNWTDAGNDAGTIGQSLRIEALKIQLVNAAGYTVQYQVDVENLGWQPWVQDGQEAGTNGKGLRIQGIRVRIVSNLDGITLPPINDPSNSVLNSTAYKLADYLSVDSNVNSTEKAAVVLHSGDQSNNCVYFSSEALRRVGFYVPTTMANTAHYVPYLVNNGFVKYTDIGKVAPGSICFTVNDGTGNPTHTFVFLDWVNPDDHTQAYVADNQSDGVHIRSMIDAPNIDPFAFFLHN